MVQSEVKKGNTMTVEVEFEGGPLDGKKVSWSARFILFGNHLYITVCEGCFQIPKRYKYMGEARQITLGDLKESGY